MKRKETTECLKGNKACAGVQRGERAARGLASALYLESSSSFWTPPSRKKDSGVPSTTKYLRRTRDEINNGVPKGKQGMCRLRKSSSRLGLRALHREQLETWGSALYLESSSRDLGLRALSREQLELLDSALSEKDSGVPRSRLEVL
ncbi:hypothetical protein GGX14DRAFT_404477 [Mycena pura]|uniref:Uncharacterized protein n=1 Tax=Mycena pura TaxID=153505 RepID=A0AAD6UU99_9AGAR|nr:hypothetical protein GGX14DRAFT_404477 [Mycena pura]